MHDIEHLRKNSESIAEYLTRSRAENTAFRDSLHESILDENTIRKLRRYNKQVVIFAFSAEWCPDCYRNIPILESISEATGIEVNVFGNLMRDPLRPKGYWSVPPSPPEVEEFNVKKIPTIVILDCDGKRIGEIVENPPEGLSLQKTIFNLVEKSVGNV